MCMWERKELNIFHVTPDHAPINLAWVRGYMYMYMSPQPLYISSRVQVRPHAGIFINNYTSSDEEVHLNYTMIANDLVLTKYRPNNGTGIPTGIDSNETLKSLSLEIHRRSV